MRIVSRHHELLLSLFVMDTRSAEVFLRAATAKQRKRALPPPERHPAKRAPLTGSTADPDTAGDNLERWQHRVQSRPRSIGRWLQWARAVRTAEGVSAAQRVLRQALSTEDNYRQPRLWHALIDTYRSDEAVALRDAQRAVRVLPRAASLWQSYARLWYAQRTLKDEKNTADESELEKGIALPADDAELFEGRWLAALSSVDATLAEREQVYLCWAQLQFEPLTSSADASSTAATDDPGVTILQRGAQRLDSPTLWIGCVQRALEVDGRQGVAVAAAALRQAPRLALHPDWVQMLRRSGVDDATILGRFAATASSFRDQLEREPRDWETWIALAQHDALVRRQPRTALRVLDRALALATASTDAPIGRILRCMGEIETRHLGAATTVRKRFGRVLGQTVARAARDEIYREYLSFESSIRCCPERCRTLFQLWASEAPTSTAVWLAWSDMEWELGERERALAILDVACSLPPPPKAPHRRTPYEEAAELQLWHRRFQRVQERGGEPAAVQESCRVLFEQMTARMPHSVPAAAAHAAFEAAAHSVEGMARAQRVLQAAHARRTVSGDGPLEALDALSRFQQALVSAYREREQQHALASLLSTAHRWQEEEKSGSG